MITIPTPVRRHWGRAFATASALLVASAGALVTWALALPGGPLGGAAAGLATGAALHASEGLRVGAYESWAKLARRVSNLVAGYITRLLFWVVTVAGRGGSSFMVSAPSGATSNWTPKNTVDPQNYESQHTGPGGNSGGWGHAYLSWGLRSAGIWVWALYPLVALLGLVQTQEKGSFGGNVYTLY
ncbi:MAG: hypothetical protein ACR2QM_11865 [Longimicrobiales bacterium]